ncbi:site-specific integrase [Crenobacter intestini]|uniref:Tyr recombinase domain-containing protein n=1 Tax=Crenobacter intestini TaxID=2563443 RepID=A0A4T0V240_9NEIS|nr:hypothetical protein [Crenobacter intestini]TIC85215.1 hypothetical protein E5K04_04240 [Crenobacter intestini]
MSSLGDIDLSEIKSRALRVYAEKLGGMPRRDKNKEIFSGCVTIDDFLDCVEKFEIPEEGISSVKSIEVSHISPIKAFINWANKEYVDEMNGRILPNIEIDFLCAVVKNRQLNNRVMTESELKAVFEGEAMRKASQENEELYWLAHILLLTGMRVSEPLLINPHFDIQHKDGVYFFDLNEKSKKEGNGVGSIKNGSGRVIPIRNDLIRLGFLNYVEDIKGRRKDCGNVFNTLFPRIAACGKPNSAAGRKIRLLFGSAGVLVQDVESVGDIEGSIRGAHAIRKTFNTMAITANEGSRALIEDVLGHLNGGSSVNKRDYDGGRPISQRVKAINALSYDLRFHKTKYAKDE